MKDKSIWLDGVKRKKRPKLDKDIDCDTLIIGGGITGICSAYFLSNNNEKIVLVERNKLCMGTTSKSTGKLTYLQDDMINKIKNIYDEELAIKYINSQKEAIRLAKKIIIDNNIKCNFESVNSYIFNNCCSNSYKIYENFKLYKKALNSNYCNIKVKDNIPIKTKCYKAIEVNDTFVFNPVKFVLGLSEVIKDKVDIYENTNVVNIEYIKNISDNDGYLFLVKTSGGYIRSKRVVLACHYPFFLFPYLFPLKTSIEKSFLVAASVEKNKLFSAINIDKDVLSLRYYHDRKNYLIYVSENGTLSNKSDNIKYRDNAIWNMRRKFSPDIKYAWSNYDIMTWDYLPLVGEIEKNLYIATGYNTWGMTNGILAGKIISDLILKKTNYYSSLFDPNRDIKNIPKIINFCINNGFSFIKSKFILNKNFYRSNVRIIKENDTWYGVYIDENKKEHKVLNLCPHLKCNLSFNYQDKTWDCPCHGSRFDIDGNVIFGPATYNIKVPKKR